MLWTTVDVDLGQVWRFSERTATRDAELGATRQAVFEEVEGLAPRGVAGSYQSDTDLYLEDEGAASSSTADFEVRTREGGEAPPALRARTLGSLCV